MENEDCSPCPVGTFGVMANDEPSCQLCPGTIGPGKTGLTDKSQCELQGQYVVFKKAIKSTPKPKCRWKNLKPSMSSNRQCIGAHVNSKTQNENKTNIK